MYIRPSEQNLNLNQVGIINDDNELNNNQKKVEQKLTVEEAVATLGHIPDEINFTHNFQFLDKCYERQEESIFYIESIGELKLGGHVKSECKFCKQCKFPPCSCAYCLLCCKMLPCCCCFVKCAKCCTCCPNYEDEHYYQIPSYILQNDKLRFEHYSSFAKLYIKDTFVLEFHYSPLNSSDICCASCKSNVPHAYYTNPLNEKNEKIYFEPLGNKCPKNPSGCCYCCTLCSFFGINELERTIVATIEENKFAKIISRRPKRNAWLSQCGCQDKWCCHFIDYPYFEMKFTNLSNIQKLGLIMSAISYTIHGRWSQYQYRGLFNLNTSYLDF